MESVPANVIFNPAQVGSKSYHMRQSLRLAWPIILSQLSHTSVQLADAVFVGNTGSADALATMSFANSVFLIPLIAGIGLSMGLSPLVSQSMGEGLAERNLGKLLTNSFYLNTLVGLGLSLVLIAMEPLVPYFGQDEAVTLLSGPVITLLSLSLIPVMMYQALRQWMEGQGLTKAPMWVSVGANLVNIGLNWVFVYGHFGAPAMGVLGAALATLISRVLMIFGMVLVVVWHAKLKPYLPKDFGASWATIKQLLQMGVPVGLQLFFEVGAFSFAAIMVGWLGAVQQSAHQIAIAVASFTYMGANGISTAGTVRVGYYFGARDGLGLRLASRSAYQLGLGYMILAAVLLVAGHTKIPYLFFPTESVAGPAAAMLLFAAFFQVADGAQVVGLGVLRGMGDVKIPTLVAAVSYWLVAIPLGYFLGFYLGLGANGVWMGLTAGLFVAAVALYKRYQKLYRVHQAEFALAHPEEPTPRP